MSQAAFSLRDCLRVGPPAPHQWTITPVCVSLLVHVVILGLISPLGRFDLSGLWPGRPPEYRIAAETISPAELERVVMVPDATADEIDVVQTSALFARDQLPTRRDAGPVGALAPVAPRNLAADGAATTGRRGLTGLVQAFVRDGDLDATARGAPRAPVLLTGRPVDRGTGPALGAAPGFRDSAGALAGGVTGRPAAAKAGPLPDVKFAPPVRDGYAPGREAASMGRDAESLLADRGDAGPAEPLDLDVKLDVCAEPGGALRYFRLALREKEGARLLVMAKDVLFVVDISASIRPEMLKAVQGALGAAAAGFNAGDRFNVVRFSEQSFRAFDGFVPATAERLAEAAKTVRREPGQMRTDVYGALKDVVAGLSGGPEGGRPVNIYLVSDGSATSGVQDIRFIVNELSAVMKPGYSVYAVNPGAAVANSYFLDLLAYRNRGAFVRAADAAGADVAILRMLAEYKSPVLVDVRALYGNFDADQVYPTVLPNLCAGRAMVIYGRCRPGDALAVRIVGDGAKGRRKFLYTCTLPEVSTDDATIMREWARGRIHYLAALIARDGEKKEYLDEIARLSEQHGLWSPYK